MVSAAFGCGFAVVVGLVWMCGLGVRSAAVPVLVCLWFCPWFWGSFGRGFGVA